MRHRLLADTTSGKAMATDTAGKFLRDALATDHAVLVNATIAPVLTRHERRSDRASLRARPGRRPSCKVTEHPLRRRNQEVRRLRDHRLGSLAAAPHVLYCHIEIVSILPTDAARILAWVQARLHCLHAPIAFISVRFSACCCACQPSSSAGSIAGCWSIADKRRFHQLR